MSEHEETELLQSKGVSVKFLSELLERVLHNIEAVGVHLVVLKNDVEYDNKVFPKGMTVKKAHQYSREGEVPYLGKIKFNQRDVYMKKRSDWTVADIFEHVVRPTVKQTGKFYIDYINNKNRVGNDFQGAYVCNARSCSFAALVDSLVVYFGAKNIQKSFVWIDIFCLRQPLTPDDRQLLLKSGLQTIISGYSERLIFFQSWVKPVTLQDSWCVWEIFCASGDKNVMFEIILPSEEQEFFVDTLVGEYDSIIENVRQISSAEARCPDPAEQEQITTLISSHPEGYSAIDEVIKSKIWQWLSDTAVTASQTLLDELQLLYRAPKNGDQGDRKAERARATRQVIELLGYTGKILIEVGRFDDAKGYLKEALKLSKRFYGEKSDDFALRLNNLGALYSLLGKLDSALDFYVESLNIRKKLHGKRHSSLAVCLNNISLLLQQKGRYSDAITCQKKALSIDKATHGATHIEVGTDLLNLGNLYCDIGKYDKALSILHDSLKIHKSIYGESHPHVATVYNNLAGVFSDKRDIEKAVEYQQMALEIDKQVYGDANIEVSTDLSNLATYLSMLKKYKGVDKTNESIECFFKALEIKEKLLGRQHASVATLLNNLAHLYKDAAQWDLAKKYGLQAVSILEKVLGPQHPHTITAKQVWNTSNDGKGPLSALKREKVMAKTLSQRVLINMPGNEVLRTEVGDEKKRLKKTESMIILTEVRGVKEDLKDQRE